MSPFYLSKNNIWSNKTIFSFLKTVKTQTYDFHVLNSSVFFPIFNAQSTLPPVNRISICSRNLVAGTVVLSYSLLFPTHRFKAITTNIFLFSSFLPFLSALHQQQHSLSSPLKRKYIDTTTVANGSNSANGGPLATPLTSSSSSKLPPPSGPPPPPPTSSCLSSSSSVNNNNSSSVGCCSTSLAVINGGGDGGQHQHHQQCPPAPSANVSTSTANGTPCKAATAAAANTQQQQQQQVPGGLSSANGGGGGGGGPNLAAISGSISESAAEKLKDIELSK